MRHDQTGGPALRRIETAIAELYEGQSTIGQARLLGFFHMLSDPEHASVRFSIRKSGRIVLVLETRPEVSGLPDAGREDT